MKIVLQGKAKQHPEIAGLLLEDKLLHPENLKEMLNLKNLEIERIEGSGDEQIVYVKEKKNNLLQE